MITHAHTTTADVHEAKCTSTIHSALREKDLLPEDHLADAAYIDAGHLSDASKEGFRLIGPTRKNPSWQTRSGEGFSQQDFDIDYRTEAAVCPAGKTAASWREYENERRGRYVKVRFSQSDCLPCELKAKCTKAKSRSLLLHVGSAAAVNLTRVGAWLFGDRPEPTRTSRFARLAA